MKKLIALLLALLCLGLCATAGAEGLKAPSDFAFDPATGEITFVSNDDNAGYYLSLIHI